MMVEAKKNLDAVFMISELAKLLRISLSKGRTVIRISDEIQHSRSYMNIQKFDIRSVFRSNLILMKRLMSTVQ